MINQGTGNKYIISHDLNTVIILYCGKFQGVQFSQLLMSMPVCTYIYYCELISWWLVN